MLLSLDAGTGSLLEAKILEAITAVVRDKKTMAICQELVNKGVTAEQFKLMMSKMAQSSTETI